MMMKKKGKSSMAEDPMAYVPTYLLVQRDAHGWPNPSKELPPEERGWLVKIAREVLQEAGKPLDLRIVCARVLRRAEREVENTTCFRAADWDYRMALVHRALLSIGAEEKWCLPEK